MAKICEYLYIYRSINVPLCIPLPFGNNNLILYMQDLNIKPVTNKETNSQYNLSLYGSNIPKKIPPVTIDYHLVMRGFTSASGLCRAKIPLAGNYLVKIVSKGNIRSFNNHSLAVDNCSECMTKTFFESIFLNI